MASGSPRSSSPGASGPVLLGRYEQFFRIASGGMAEVHVGRIRGEAGFEKLVAIKRMLPHLAEDERFVDMFLDEARVASNVTSPHVVQTLDLGRADDGSLFLVLELVVGASLWALMRASARRGVLIPLPIALELVAQAAQGLDDAHEATTPTGLHLGIVHRDVSPQNLLVGVDGRCRVTDFGIARALMRRTSTSTGELKGKIAYFSPEQARAKEVDRRSDVFALGVVAWEAITGHRLFGNDEALRTLQRVLEQPIADPRTLRTDLGEGASSAVMKALSRDLATRWQSAAEFATALREAARELGPPVLPREIGRWVADLAGEPLKQMRERIDAALASRPAGDDTEIRVDTEDESATNVAGAQSIASGIIPVTRTNPSDVVPSSPSAVSARSVVSAPSGSLSVPPSLSQIAASEPSAEEIAALQSGRRKVRAAIVGAVVVAAVGAVFWLGRMSGPASESDAPAASAAAAPSANAATAEPAPSATAAAVAEPSVTPSATPSAAPDVDRPAKAAAKDRAPATETAAAHATHGSAEHKTEPEPAAAPPPATAVAASPAPPPAAPAPLPATKPAPGSTGPLLGDDAFNRDVSHMH